MKRFAALMLLLAVACSDENEPVNADASVSVDATVLADSGAADAGVNADAETFPDAAETFPDAQTFPDAAPIDPVDTAGMVELVQGGFQFIEGPVWRPAQELLLFSDIDANRIFFLMPPSTVDTFRSPSERSNGLALDINGAVLACHHESRRVTRIEQDGMLTTLAAEFEGGQLNSPNDLVVRSDNTIYFTDPPFGLGNRMRELDFNGVFRIDPQGNLTAEWRGSLASRPNGIALSPDESLLYLADSAATQVRVFDVAAGGALSNERPFVTTAAVEDGMTVDVDGNLYVTTQAGVEVFAPDGTGWGTITVPQQPANVTFGDTDKKTLYITARTGLYRARMQIGGR